MQTKNISKLATESLFGLTSRTREKLYRVFDNIVEMDRVVIYGSRAKGNYKPGSDIDLTLFGSNLTFAILAKLDHTIDELLLPYKVDLSLFASLQHPELEDHIKRVGQDFYVRLP